MGPRRCSPAVQLMKSAILSLLPRAATSRCTAADATSACAPASKTSCQTATQSALGTKIIQCSKCALKRTCMILALPAAVQRRASPLSARARSQLALAALAALAALIASGCLVCLFVCLFLCFLVCLFVCFCLFVSWGSGLPGQCCRTS